MNGVTKYLPAAAASIALLVAATPAFAADVRAVPTASPLPGFVPKVFPPTYPPPGIHPPTPGWPRPPFPSPWPVPPTVDYDYKVMVRVGGFIGWREYGTYESRRQAERVELLLESRGYQTRVVRVPDRFHILDR